MTCACAPRRSSANHGCPTSYAHSRRAPCSIEVSRESSQQSGALGDDKRKVDSPALFDAAHHRFGCIEAAHQPVLDPTARGWVEPPPMRTQATLHLAPAIPDTGQGNRQMDYPKSFSTRS